MPETVSAVVLCDWLDEIVEARNPLAAPAQWVRARRSRRIICLLETK